MRMPAGFRKRADGFENRFTVDNVRYSVYGSTIRECQEKEIEKRKELAAGLYHSNDTITLNQYYDEWIAQKKLQVKPSTIFSYQTVFKNHILPALGRYRVKNIERRHVITLLNGMAARNLVGQANYVKRLIVQILKAAVADEIILRNVAANLPPLKTKKAPARETIHRELNDRELKAFFKAVKNSRYYNAFRFMLYTGVRVGECAALQWLDIDREKGVIHIRRTATRGLDGKTILGQDTKTRRSKRNIPMNESIRQIIDEQWALYCDTHSSIRINDFVFPNERGELSEPGTYGVIIQHTLKKLKEQHIFIDPFSVHAFRDTFASRAARAGIAPNTLKEILGHVSLAMTMDLYTHINELDKKEGMEKLQAIDL